MQIDKKDGTTYMDCTDNFPVRLIDIMMTMFIMYDWSSNSIMSEAMPNTKDTRRSTDRGFKPHFNILDTIAFKVIVKFLKEECNIGIQLVEPYNYRGNTEERAIEQHLKAILSQDCARVTEISHSCYGHN